jgi:uncharacterized protein YndB with AHSA1/START domain
MQLLTSAQVSITIKSSTTQVWKALLSNEILNKYYYLYEDISSFEVGSIVSFNRIINDLEITDTGSLVEYIEGSLMKFKFLNSSEILPGIQVEFYEITYKLIDKNGFTFISIHHDGIENELYKEQYESNWALVLDNLKILLEKIN